MVGPVSFSALQCWGDSRRRSPPSFLTTPHEPSNRSDRRTRSCTQVKRGKSGLLYSVHNWTWTKKAKGLELAFGKLWYVSPTAPPYPILPHQLATALCPTISVQPMRLPRALAFRVAPY